MVKNRFKILLSRKELELGRSINYDEIYTRTGISPSTLSRWATNRINRFDSDVIIKLCQFLNCDLSELLIIQ